MDVRGRWVDVEYVIRDLNGDIVYNRNEETARLLGTFTKYTHYIPDRLYIASRQDLSDIPSGIYQAITEITPGETWRVYIPSRLAFASYGIQTSTGYGGQQALESDVPVILDSLRIVNIVDNPQSEGRQAIEEFVTASRPEGWGKPLNDTVREGLYMDILARPNPGDTVPLNQSANIYYRCGFLDGHLIDSNIDTVLYNRFGTVRSSDVTSPIRVTRMSTDPNNANQMPAKVFYAILPDLCYGDSVRIAVPSEYGYYRQYMYPDKSSSMWSSSATFTFDFTYQYKDYTTEDTDYFFRLLYLLYALFHLFGHYCTGSGNQALYAVDIRVRRAEAGVLTVRRMNDRRRLCQIESIRFRMAQPFRCRSRQAERYSGTGGGPCRTESMPMVIRRVAVGRYRPLFSP